MIKLLALGLALLAVGGLYQLHDANAVIARHVQCYDLDSCDPGNHLCRTKVVDEVGIVKVRSGVLFVNGIPVIQQDCTIE